MTSVQPIRGDDDEGREPRRDITSDAHSDTKAIREEIASTRMRMSETLDEIGDRLNPQTIKDNVKESIKEATIGRVSDMARNATDSVQRGTSGIANAVRENPIPAAMIAIGLGWMFFNGRSDGADRGVQQLATNVKDKSGELAESVKERAQSMAASVSETGRRGQGRVEDAFTANPLALGAVAVAAGLAVGLSAPKTDRELRLMGGETPSLA